MGTNSHQESELYHPDDDRELSTAIVETVADLKDMEITETEFQLYDDINTDALNNLFRKDATANTTVAFDTDDVIVTLWGDGTVKIKVVSQTIDR
ncbi:HalOD1 output domain-containing protein [Haladaptatus pallidirubidus]|uniref:Halobacterial output domain-containing protein n=1 Tax=Haladaptatus pallidirubidus TaxID=1008152 RepID=A0AAV3UR72_9EURY|nr:HalOD1 output domain-containing protein [Haladaptatus pallidirubidus]